jgi:hypothetical protein
MAEPHLDNPGEIRWFKGEGPAAVLGPCPHTACKHLGQSVIAWGPSYDRYELVDCGSLDPADESDSECARQCRAWTDKRGHVATTWLNVRTAEQAAPA